MEVGAERAVGAAQDATRIAQLGAQGTQITTAADVASAEVAREQARVTGGQAIADQQLNVLAERGNQAWEDMNKQFRENAYERTELGIQGAKTGLEERLNSIGMDRDELNRDRSLHDARTADISVEMARWALDHVPDLPDYATGRFTTTVGSLLGLGASFLD